jgi:uncharacterized caspase-like protein
VKASNDLTLTRVREIRLVRTLDVTRAAEAANQAEARDAMGSYEALLVATDRQAGELRAARDAAEALGKQQGQQVKTPSATRMRKWRIVALGGQAAGAAGENTLSDQDAEVANRSVGWASSRGSR